MSRHATCTLVHAIEPFPDPFVFIQTNPHRNGS